MGNEKRAAIERTVGATPAPKRNEAELRAGVVRLCEQALRDLVLENNAKLQPHRRVDPEVFIRGIHALRERDEAAKQQRAVNVRAARAVHAILTALDEAPEIFSAATAAGMPDVHRLAQLRRLVGPLENLQHLGTTPKPSEFPDDDDATTRRQYVLCEFDTDDFLGTGRRATTAELAAISLLLDPDHGCGDPRRADAGKPWVIKKQERDAIDAVRSGSKKRPK